FFRDGFIKAISPADVIQKQFSEEKFEERIDCSGKCILPDINFFSVKPLGAEWGAQAISHLEDVSDEGIAAMVTARCSALLLPTTAYMLRLMSVFPFLTLKQPPARKMLDEGVIVALGSDFNPNAYCFSVPMVTHLACVNMSMSMPELLAAATISAADALGQSHTHGSLEVGKQGDLIVINSSRWEPSIYQFGGHHELIEYVIAKGKVIYKKL
ncbi:probable imidazolonepropionase, partial [Pteropus alecto]|uniref:probable imidazolonepropionase n=1 Tax=Pteropus alecto TaxID=9402 RepID=UPI000D532EB9